ncbi:MAG: thioredoxin family protein [Bacteroidales bacterium]
MNKLFLYLSLLLLSLTFYTNSSAQRIEQPVEWKSSVVKLEENLYQIKLIGTLDIDRPEWHLYDLGPYQDGPTPTTLTIETEPKGFELVGKPELLSRSIKKFDPMFGMEIGICEEDLIVAQTIRVTSATDSVSILAIIEWQACDNQSCLPPTDKEFTIKLPGAKGATKVAAKSAEASNSAAVAATTAKKAAADKAAADIASANLAAANEIASAAQESNITPAAQINSPTKDSSTSKSIWGVIVEAIIWGFVALLTPCVFPMVPMTVSFFLKQSQNSQEALDKETANGGSNSNDSNSANSIKKRSNAKGKVMATFFGISIITLYTLPIAAIIIITYFAGGEAVTADMFNWLATHWIPNILFFLIFMIFAISFFGAFEIVLPSWMVNKSDAKSDKGGYAGVFFMALTLVLVSFSCTGPIVGTILIKSTQGEIWEPIITMFAFSTAFALPFTVFAFAPSLLKDLPKSGGWLNSVKVVLGFIEVALGFKFLSVADQVYHWGLLDREIYLAIWIVVFTLMGFYLLGKLRFAHDSPTQHITVKRLFMAIATFVFVVYMIPGMWGAPLKGLSGYLPPISSQDFKSAQLGDIQLLNGGGTTYGIGNNGNGINGVSKEANNNISLRSQGIIPKYSDFLHLPHGLEGFFTYNEAIEYAKKVGKPLFLDFTGHGCVNCREMEARVWSDPRVLTLLRQEFVILALYADDKKKADESDWVTTESGRVLKTIGKINSDLVMRKYNANAQPYYVILDPATEQNTTEPMGYNLDIDTFIEFLENGIEGYRNR